MKYPSQIQLETKERKGNRVVALSGRVTRNMDWFSGKHFRFMPSGIRLEDYRSNPILLWSHNARSIEAVLGTASVVLENDRLVAEPTFHEASDESRLAKKLWEMGVLNAVSVRVGFTPDDMTKFVEGEREIVITAGELQELSIVTVPADPGAVREAALSLGISPEQATRIIMEANMDKDTLIEEGIEMGDEAAGSDAVFSPDEQVEIALMLTTNEAAYHVLYAKIEADMSARFEEKLSAIEEKYDRAIAKLNGEHFRKDDVPKVPQRSLFGDKVKEKALALSAAPPEHIRQPGRNGQAPKQHGAASKWAERTAAKQK